MQIIGLTGSARHGKDTVADYLHRFGYRRLGFADQLKAGVAAVFSLSEAQLYGDKKEEIDPVWNDTPRNIMQKFGTECMRDGYADDIWLRALRAKIDPDVGHYVISDVRFPNEADMIREMGGLVVRVVRPDAPTISTSGHSSETSMLDYPVDGVVVNSGSLSALKDLVQTRFIAWVRNPLRTTMTMFPVGEAEL